MYTDHFGLNEMPFSAEPNPRFLVLMDEHREALATMVYAIEQQEGWALIVGEPGVGKTTLIMALLRELGDRVVSAVITNVKLAPLDFMNQIALELGLEGPFASKGPFLAALGQVLNQCREQGLKLLLVVDEAQDLSAEMVEELRLLGNLDTGSPRTLNILLVGQPELIRVLKRSASRALLQRLHRNYALKPLNPGATAEYARERLALAGANREIFEPDALAAVHEVTGGVPRLINAVCDDAMIQAYAADAAKVGRAHVMQAARENPALDLEAAGDETWPAAQPAVQTYREPEPAPVRQPDSPPPAPPSPPTPHPMPASEPEPATPKPPPAWRRRLGKLEGEQPKAPPVRQPGPEPKPRRPRQTALQEAAEALDEQTAAPAKRGLFSRFAASLSREAPGSLWKRALVLLAVLGLLWGGYLGVKQGYYWVKKRFLGGGEIQLFLPDETPLKRQNQKGELKTPLDWGPRLDSQAAAESGQGPTGGSIPAAPAPGKDGGQGGGNRG
ncbi:MAG: ExeA family protein [Thermodesulfobacteriota bacterium]